VEIFGGFMVMLSILGFFLTVLWFILPFVIFGIKGKVDRMCCLLEDMDKRLKEMEQKTGRKESGQPETAGQTEAPIS
jgi:cytochrome b subunit of formate dehydrogenase